MARFRFRALMVQSRTESELVKWVRQNFPREVLIRDYENTRKEDCIPLSEFIDELERMVNGK